MVMEVIVVEVTVEVIEIVVMEVIVEVIATETTTAIMVPQIKIRKLKKSLLLQSKKPLLNQLHRRIFKNARMLVFLLKHSKTYYPVLI